MKSKTILILILSFILQGCLYANNPEIFYGKWIVEKFITCGTGSPYGESAIKQIINKEIIYSKEIASFDKVACKSPIYEKTIIYEDRFFDTHGYISFSKLGIKGKNIEEVQIFKTKEDKWVNLGSNFLVIDKNNLILYDDGTFFKLVRKK